MSRKNVNPPATSASDLPPLLLVRHLSEYRIIGGTLSEESVPPNLFPKTFNVFGEGYHVLIKKDKA